MWDEFEKSLEFGLGFSSETKKEEVCPECGYKICHCADIEESNAIREAEFFEDVCAKCGNTFTNNINYSPIVEFCDNCSYSVVVACKECGKELSVRISSFSEEIDVKSHSRVCFDCCDDDEESGL